MNAERKLQRYQRIKTQLEKLFLKTNDNTAKISTAIALLHNKFQYFFWTGFYFLKEGELTVGPYQGSVACLVLKKHTGVCWAAIDRKEVVIVPDVESFPGHIACDSRSKSEIVLPVKNRLGEIIGVMDVDSKVTNSFDEADKKGLQDILNLIF